MFDTIYCRQIFFKARKSVVREDLMEEKRKKKRKKSFIFDPDPNLALSSFGSRSYLEFKKVKTKSQAKTVKTKSQAKNY